MRYFELGVSILPARLADDANSKIQIIIQTATSSRHIQNQRRAASSSRARVASCAAAAAAAASTAATCSVPARWYAFGGPLVVICGGLEFSGVITWW